MFHWGTNRTKSLTFVFFHSVLNGFALSARRWIFSALSAPSPSPSSVSSTVSRWFGTGTWQRGIPRHRCRFGQGARRPTLTVQGLAAPPIEQNPNLRPCPILPAPWCRSRISRRSGQSAGAARRRRPSRRWSSMGTARRRAPCAASPTSTNTPLSTPSCGAEALVAAGRPHHVPVTFTEKAIMLCKASIIGDYKMYGQIQAAASPQEAKALRRSVSPFVPARWDALVCEVARAVCVQKALGVPELHAARDGRARHRRDDAKRLQLGHWPRHRPQGRLHAFPLARHQHPRLDADAGKRRDGSGGRKQRRHTRWWQRHAVVAEAAATPTRHHHRLLPSAHRKSLPRSCACVFVAARV